MQGAGGGRPRKPEGTTRHRNAPTKGETRISAADSVSSVPEPTLPFDGRRREVWDRMWRQPVAALWSEVDVAPLTRLVLLQTSKEALLDRGVLAEIRQLEDRFLMNPYARAQQRIVLEGPDGEDLDAADARASSEYGHLRAVKAG